MLGLAYDAPFLLLPAAQAGALLLARPERTPAWVRNLQGRAWALVPLASILGCIGLIDLTDDAGRWFADLALVAVPPLAALALVWLTRRPAAGLVAVALFVVALSSQGTDGGDLAGVALDLLACAALGGLLAAVAPPGLLKVGILLMATGDAALVLSSQLQDPNATLNAAAPGPGLPQLQRATFDGWQSGFGDLFLGGVLGGVLARERRAPVAALTFVLAALFALLFWVLDTIPATVPVALALLVEEARARYAARRAGREERASSYAAATSTTARSSAGSGKLA